MEIRAATPDDLDGVYELLVAPEVDRAQLAEAWRVEAEDRLVAVEGGIVGYAVLDGGGHAGFAGPGAHVLDALRERVETRGRERGFTKLTAIVEENDESFGALVRRSGFTQHGEVLRMWRRLNGSVPEPLWPSGVRVRTYENGDARSVQALLDAAYAGWDETHVEQPHEEWLQWMTDHDEFDPALWFLVQRGDELVACALHWKEHSRSGWLKDIVVRADERGAGIGRALLEHGLHAYAQRGVERVGLKVGSTNPTGAVRLYESADFEVDRRYGIWVKDL